MKLFKYYKDHKLAVFIVLVFLVIQAFADLALPNLTSQIVDVGIQQAGIESVTVDEMSKDTYDCAMSMANEDERPLLEDSYTKTPNGTYTLTEFGRAHKEKLDGALELPLILMHRSEASIQSADAESVSSNNAQNSRIDSYSQVLDDLKAGRIDREELFAQMNESQAQSMGSTSEMLHQQAISAARSEYEQLGYDLTDMQFSYLLRIGLAMLGLAALGMAMSILIGFVASRTGGAIGRDLRNELFAKVVSFSENEISQFSAASLITRGTNDIQLIQNVSVMLLRMVLSAPILAIGGIIMVMATNAQMGWVIVVAILCVFIVIAIVFKVAMPKFKIMQKLIDRVNLVAREILNGMPVIRAFNRQGYEIDRFNDASLKLMKTQLFTNRVMTFMMPAMMLIMNVTSVAIVWVGSGYIDTGAIQTGDLIAFITYSMIIIMSFLMIGMISIMLPRADVAAGRVNEVIGTEPAIRDKSEPVTEAATAGLEADKLQQQDADSSAWNRKGDSGGVGIAFKDVSFAYKDSDECVLEHIDFTVKPGQTFAIIGSTGSGKSTILKLLLRFYDVSSGSIEVNGIDIRELPQHELRKQFGYIPQRSFLFSGTIESNVKYANEDISDAEVERALEIAQALDFVNKKEDGVDTEVSQGGTNVSGGQRQRLSIARAIASGASAYLFDDSFSALDYSTDLALRQAIRKNMDGVTQVIVAQRISTIMDADAIMVLEEGRQVGLGKHDEIMQSCREYREIALSQLSSLELGYDKLEAEGATADSKGGGA